MPKVHDTRKQRAAELLERVTNGPAWAMDIDPKVREEIKAAYKTWSESWVLRELKALVPELREKKKKS